MNKDELSQKIKDAQSKNDINDIVNEIMATPIPWFFTNEFPNSAISKYQEFKTYMAGVFDIPPTDVFICGRALLGFSLSPEKNFSDFNVESDIDIVIIKKKLFESYWKQFFEDYVFSDLTGIPYTRTAKNIFKHFIDFHYDYTSNLALYKEWEKKTSGYIKDLQIKFNFPEKISYRIYSSYDDYKQNLIKTIYDIKNPYIKEGE